MNAKAPSAVLAAVAVVLTATAAGQRSSDEHAGGVQLPSAPTLNLNLNASQNPFQGSVPTGKASGEVMPLSLKEAIDRGIRQNLGLLFASQSMVNARGEVWRKLSELLPQLNVTTAESVNQINLQALGFNPANFPGLNPIVGPFNYFDVRANLSEDLALKSFHNWRAAGHSQRAAELSFRDARELVVLAVGATYLQALADGARIDTARAQVQTAQSLYDRAVDQQRAGLSPAIDVLRARVELQSLQQQLIVAENTFAKQKLALARTIGLPAGQQFGLTEKAPYTPLTDITLESALSRAYSTRQDFQSAAALLRSAEWARRGASAEYLPSISIDADYGDIGVTPGNSHGTFHVTGTLKVPIFQGGKVHGDVLQADSLLQRRRSELEDLRGRIDFEVRTAFLDLKAASDQVEVARSSVDLATQALAQAQDRFAAGVTNNIEVIQAQQSLAAANESYISSVYAHNVAKLSLARAVGIAEQGVRQYLGK
ncbi:MAG TPA: TolC family protein [Terriglobales bacterium]|nr:TolC family protein [Terriglobales bacterium]